MSDQTIESTIREVLRAGQISEESWDGLRGNLLRSSPVWPGDSYTVKMSGELAQFIDHTLLKPDATDAEIGQLCEEALRFQFASVCVNSCHVKICTEKLSGSTVEVCSVVGFPLGAMATEAKRTEAQIAVDHGAKEIDMVLNIGKFKSGDADYICNDIQSVVDAAWGNPVKVILETGFLNTNEIIVASVISLLSGATFLKTSTGMGPGKATEEDVRLMRTVAGVNLGVKASGGIRDAATAVNMIRAGANRIGTSRGVDIVTSEMSAV